MALVRLDKMVIEVTEENGKVSAEILSADESVDVPKVNRNLEYLVGIFRPAPGVYVASLTNEVAEWLAKNMNGEVTSYDKVHNQPDTVY